MNNNETIFNYIFNKNKFSLSKYSNTLNNKNLDYCKKYSINNNKSGFQFYGNNNICQLYSNTGANKKIDNSMLNKYNIKKFIKNNKQKYANPEEQNNPNYYFQELNHYNFEPSKIIKKEKVSNLDNCMNHCLNNNKCNSIIYYQQPNICKFYNNIDLSNNKNKEFDSYTINQKELNNDKLNLDNLEQEEELDKPKDHNKFFINNNKYSNCFTNQSYSNYSKLINSYNNICKNDLGSEYAFSNENNHHNIKNCEKNKIKILCKPQFFENFNNLKKNNLFFNINSNPNSRILYILCLIILLFFIFTLLHN